MYKDVTPATARGRQSEHLLGEQRRLNMRLRELEDQIDELNATIKDSEGRRRRRTQRQCDKLRESWTHFNDQLKDVEAKLQEIRDMRFS